MAMAKTRFLLACRVLIVLVLFILFDCGASKTVIEDASASAGELVPIGAVVDLNSAVGTMADLCMKMAISDFYSANQNYKTRLQLKIKNSHSLLDSHFAVVELMEQEKVQAIVGPQGSKEVKFLAEVGARFHVPVISFTARTSALSLIENHYFVTIQDDEFQAQALAAICKKFEWPQVVVVYEDADHLSGNLFVSLLTKALVDVEIELAYMAAVPTLAEDSKILGELGNLKRKQTRVFLVHMDPSLGRRFFGLAKKMGMMSEGFAWIITDSLSNSMNSIDSVTRDGMEGVVGIRPYVSQSRNLEDFQERWKRNVILKNMTGLIMELNVYGLWAYDAVTALAIAVERIGNLNSSSYREKNPENFGSRLVKELSRTKFRGLSGEFELVDGKLKPLPFEIFNVMGSGERRLGFWTRDRGISRGLSSTGEKTKELKKAMWPGDSVATPKGWSIPANGKLRIGIPWKHGFREFVNVRIDPATNHTNATGFSVDIFLAALNFLPFPIRYEFLHYNDTKSSNWYDGMLREIPHQKYDMVVGDTTIWAPRAEYVDFSLPYSESGVILVVKNKKPFDMWIFVKPLKWDLWLAITVACLLMALVIYVLERRATKNSRDSAIREKNERAGTIYWSSVAVLAFPDSNMVSNNWSLFVLVFWLFMAFILMQSYTANLSAILTVDQLKFAFSDNYYVGYQEGSFMEEFLTKHLNINSSRLRNYSSVEEFHDAMSKGSKHGGIDVVFDEIPYMKLFLKTYASQYKMVGPIYKTGGFGFAFPYGSPLAAYFSRAILNVTQGPDMASIEQRNFGPGYSSQDQLSSTISQGTSSLTFLDFAGLFIIVGSVTIFALFCSETPIGRKLTDITRTFVVPSCSRDRTSRVRSMEGDGVEDDSTHSVGEESHESAENTASSPPPEGSNAEVTGASPRQGEGDIVAMDQHGIQLSPS